MKRLIWIATFLLITCYAHSDQYAYISKPLAQQTVEILHQQDQIMILCEPCEQLQPEFLYIESVKMSFTNYEQFWEVKVNDQFIDLAYTYIQQDSLWINLAFLFNLEPSSVSLSLENSFNSSSESSQENTLEIKRVNIEDHQDNRNEIITKLDQCLENNLEANNISNCYYQSQKDWMNELENIYQLLMLAVDKDTKFSLEQSHQTWLTYYEQEWETIDSLFYAKGLTSPNYEPIKVSDQLRILQFRVDQLYDYYDYLHY